MVPKIAEAMTIATEGTTHVTVGEGGSTTTATLGPYSVEKNNQELGNRSRVSHIAHCINRVGEVEQPLEEENGDSLDFEEDDLDDVPDQDDSEGRKKK
ncbi:hypothetical protein RDI58_029105 [Solanum bulbocastanum]|uniref:Uncharacterized protein n=1 Tax=Solanum bulbocastanum TaxID=147425 RepID=A0AAN8SVR3_SOLBU